MVTGHFLSLLATSEEQATEEIQSLEMYISFTLKFKSRADYHPELFVWLTMATRVFGR